MTTKIFDTNLEMGTQKLWHYDADKDEATIQTIIDATEVIVHLQAALHWAARCCMRPTRRHHLAHLHQESRC